MSLPPLTPLVAFASAITVAFSPLAACNAAPSGAVWPEVNRICLTGRSVARWKALDPALKEATYSEYCRDEADWAVTMCKRIGDPAVSSTEKQGDTNALVANVGHLPCTSLPGPGGR